MSEHESRLLRVLDRLIEPDQKIRERAFVGGFAPNQSLQHLGWGKDLVGLGIDHPYADDTPVGELALKLYVRDEPARSRVFSEVGPVLKVQGAEAAPVEVETIGEIVPQALNVRLRPVRGGHSAGHVGGKCGSVGCVVRKRTEPDSLYLLSAAHVFANDGLGKAGDSVLQPCTGDGGASPADQIAVLVHWVPFDFSGAFVNRVDAALAGPISAADCRPQIDVINLVPAGIGPVTRGMRVQKVGKTTNHTYGKVRDPYFAFSLAYPMPGGGMGNVNFVDHALCTCYTAAGDSGALVLDDHGNAVGLHIAGTRMARWLPWGRSIFSPIQPVLDALNVDIVMQPF